MRLWKTVVGIALVMIIVAPPLRAGNEPGVTWVDASWEAVLAQAKEQNKHVFVDFYTTWCGPCKMLDKETFVNAKVIEFLDATVPVKYDCEKGFGKTLAAQYKIVAYPTLVVLDSQGQEVDRFVGFLGPDDFVDVMDGYLKGVGTVAYYQKMLAESPDDIETLHTLGMKYADAVRVDDAVATLGKVVEMDPKDEHGWHAEIVYSLGNVHYSSERFDKAKAYFEELMVKHPDTDWYERALTRLASVEYKLGNNDAAVSAYLKYVKLHTDDPKALNAFAWFCSQRKIGLDRALPVALKAAELSGRDPGILDTLAEVYFAMGDFDHALEIGKEALAKDPEDTYFKDQVKKYEAAKEEADSQAHR